MLACPRRHWPCCGHKARRQCDPSHADISKHMMEKNVCNGVKMLRQLSRCPPPASMGLRWTTWSAGRVFHYVSSAPLRSTTFWWEVAQTLAFKHPHSLGIGIRALWWRARKPRCCSGGPLTCVLAGRSGRPLPSVHTGRAWGMSGAREGHHSKVLYKRLHIERSDCHAHGAGRVLRAVTTSRRSCLVRGHGRPPTGKSFRAHLTGLTQSGQQSGPLCWPATRAVRA